MHVFIVDDEPDLVVLTTAFLKKHGYRVSSSNAVKEAREKLINANFDVCLLDVHLPDGSGFELAETIMHDQKKARIIMMSAYDDVAEELRQHPEIKKFIKKPFRQIEVLNAIRQA